MKEQDITPESLLRHGYTIRGAARAIKRSPGHVYLVVTGQRKSDPTLADLASLPKRELSLSRRKEVAR